jgi:hypothetical protein
MKRKRKIGERYNPYHSDNTNDERYDSNGNDNYGKSSYQINEVKTLSYLMLPPFPMYTETGVAGGLKNHIQLFQLSFACLHVQLKLFDIATLVDNLLVP